MLETANDHRCDGSVGDSFRVKLIIVEHSCAVVKGRLREDHLLKEYKCK